MNRVGLPFAARFVVVFAVAACTALWAFGATAKPHYQVSYAWGHSLENVEKYREKVSNVLGPEVAQELKVVHKGNMYGLIYMRNGDSAGAAKVARSHSRLLHRAGLGKAAPMRDGSWTVIGPGEQPPEPHAASITTKLTPRAEQKPDVHDLEAAVADYIQKLRRNGRLSADERTGWSVYDFTTGEKLVTINEDNQFQAASLIKPFVAVAFFQKVKDGDFIYGPRSRRHLERMIHWSNNRSTNWVMRQIGGPKAVQRILQAHYPDIFQNTNIVEYIPASGRTYRNKASVHDYSRFLYALWNGDLPGAREIRRLMALPGSDRISTGVTDLPNNTKVYNKTGSTAHLCGDMGILIVKGPDGKSYPYTIVGIIEKRHKARNYTRWIRSRGDIIRDVSGIVYTGITNYHDFGDMVVGSAD
jgi:beta-lactamase class A